MDELLHQGMINTYAMNTTRRVTFVLLAFVVCVFQQGNPTYTSYRMFNLTNAWDVVNNGAKPIVTEEGPFVYEYTRKR